MYDVYEFVIPELKTLLLQLPKYFDKAAQHADARKYDVNNLLTARLSPDQYCFLKQVQVTCDAAKGLAGRLAGKPLPVHEDNEKTFADLKKRVEKTVAFLDTIKKDDFKGWEERPVDIFFLPGKYLLGHEYLTRLALPNFYFHLMTAYSILRQAGVDVGKMDYLGEGIPFKDKK